MTSRHPRSRSPAWHPSWSNSYTERGSRDREIDARSPDAARYKEKHWLTTSPGNEGPSSREITGLRNSERPPSRPVSALASRSQTPIDRGLPTAPAPTTGLDIDAEFGRIISKAVDMVVLSRKRDSVQKDFEEAEKAWDKTKAMESNFPASVERLKADFTNTKQLRDSLDRQIQEKKSSISTTNMADYLSSLARPPPQSQASFEDRFLKYEEKLAMFSKEIEGLKQDRSAVANRVDYLHKDIKSTMGQAGKSLHALSQLEIETRSNKNFVLGETRALKESISRIESQQPPRQDDSRQQQEQEKFDRLFEDYQNLRQKVDRLETELANTTTTNQAFASKLQAVEKGQEKISIHDEELLVLNKDIKALANNFNDLDEDVGGRVRALESRNAPPVSTVSIGTDIEAAQTHIPLSKAADQLRQSLNLSVPMFHALGHLPAKISIFGEMQEAFEAEQSTILEKSERKITQHDESLLNLEERMKRQAEDLQSLTKNLENSHETLQNHDKILAGLSNESKVFTATSQALSPNVLSKADTSQHAIQTSIAQLKSRVDSTEVGLSSLDARMNNIHTEHLGRQIIGQLSSAYPNLPVVNNALKQLVDWQTRHEPIISQCAQQLNHSFQACESMTNLGQENLAKLQNLDKVVGGLKSYVETSVKKLEGQVESIEQVVRFEGNETMKEVVERCNSATAALQEDFPDFKTSVIKSLGLLEDQVESIEHLIEYDDNETMKEKINHIFSFIKLFQEEFTTMTERYKKVMARINSHPDLISSVASPTSRTVSVQSFSKKRTASSSPSASGSGGPAVNGADRPPKRKRKEIGGFLDVDEDED